MNFERFLAQAMTEICQLHAGLRLLGKNPWETISLPIELEPVVTTAEVAQLSARQHRPDVACRRRA